MVWQTAASIATIVQAVVVIFSLLLIWRQVQQQTVQVRQQTDLARMASTQALVELSSPFNLELIKNADMAALWVSGARECDGFDDIRLYQYKSLLIWWLILHENIYYQRHKGLLDEEAYEGWEVDLVDFVHSQRLYRWWGELGRAFQKGFHDHVSDLIRDAGKTSGIKEQSARVTDEDTKMPFSKQSAEL